MLIFNGSCPAAVMHWFKYGCYESRNPASKRENRAAIDIHCKKLGAMDPVLSKALSPGELDNPIIPRLNDTGVRGCYDTHSQFVQSCPQSEHPGQDSEYGRDAKKNIDSDGLAGFSFTKLNESGYSIPANATNWSCVKDNVTGLVWEIKTDDGGLRDKDWTYSWYNSTGSNDGGYAGISNGGICYDTEHCDTEKFVQQVNEQGLCGATDWRMPTINELQSLVDYSGRVPSDIDPLIDINYFPDLIDPFIEGNFSSKFVNGPELLASWSFWTSSPSAESEDFAWYISFVVGQNHDNIKSDKMKIRLVRMGQ